MSHDISMGPFSFGKHLKGNWSLQICIVKCTHLMKNRVKLYLPPSNVFLQAALDVI